MEQDLLMAKLSLLKVDGQRMITEDVMRAWYHYREQITETERLEQLVIALERAPLRKRAEASTHFEGIRQWLVPYYVKQSIRYRAIERTIEFVSWSLLYTTHLMEEECQLLCRELMKIGHYLDGQYDTTLSYQQQADIRLAIMSEVEQPSFECCLLFSQYYPLLTVAEQLRFVVKNWAKFNSAFGATLLRLMGQYREDQAKLGVVMKVAHYETELMRHWEREFATFPHSEATVEERYEVYRQLIEQKLHDYGRSFHPQFQQDIRELATSLPSHYENEVRWLQTLPSWL